MGKGTGVKNDLHFSWEGHASSCPDRFGMRPGSYSGALPQGNTKSMNGRICWRWDALGDPGHDDACPSSAGLDFSVLRGFVYSCGPIPLSPRRNMNESREAAKARRREVEVFLLLECISACFSPRMESADGANSLRLVPGGLMPESASSPKSADEVDRGWDQVRRRRLILPANWRGALRRARIEKRASPLAPPLTLNSAQSWKQSSCSKSRRCD